MRPERGWTKAHQSAAKDRRATVDVSSIQPVMVYSRNGSVVNAVECAVAVQKSMAERNTDIEPDRRTQFRIGVNLGDVIRDETRAYGDGVNIASRIESIAQPGGICVSGATFANVHKKLPLTFTDLGAHLIKKCHRA